MKMDCTIIKVERIKDYSLKCFDKVDRHLERKNTMDLELLGYLESWILVFGCSRLMVVNKMTVIVSI